MAILSSWSHLCVGLQGAVTIVLLQTLTEIAVSVAIVNVVQFNNGSTGPCCQDDDLVHKVTPSASDQCLCFLVASLGSPWYQISCGMMFWLLPSAGNKIPISQWWRTTGTTRIQISRPWYHSRGRRRGDGWFHFLVLEMENNLWEGYVHHWMPISRTVKAFHINHKIVCRQVFLCQKREKCAAA